MRLYEKLIFGAGVAVAGITYVYRYVLGEEQRDALREIAETLTNATHEVTDSVAPLRSNVRTHEEQRAAVEANQARTASQWEQVGF